MDYGKIIFCVGIVAATIYAMATGDKQTAAVGMGIMGGVITSHVYAPAASAAEAQSGEPSPN